MASDPYRKSMSVSDVPDVMMEYVVSINKIQVLDNLKNLARSTAKLQHLNPQLRNLHDIADLLPEKERVYFNMFLLEEKGILKPEEEKEKEHTDAQIREAINDVLDEPLPSPKAVQALFIAQ